MRCLKLYIFDSLEILHSICRFQKVSNFYSVCFFLSRKKINQQLVPWSVVSASNNDFKYWCKILWCLVDISLCLFTFSICRNFASVYYFFLFFMCLCVFQYRCWDPCWEALRRFITFSFFFLCLFCGKNIVDHRSRSYLVRGAVTLGFGIKFDIASDITILHPLGEKMGGRACQ